ncbi:Uncharacterised protein [Chlamydia trachomatis]|nr:Uncharacterised protein [Chlamydia trachomatis]
MAQRIGHGLPVMSPLAFRNLEAMPLVYKRNPQIPKAVTAVLLKVRRERFLLTSAQQKASIANRLLFDFQIMNKIWRRTELLEKQVNSTLVEHVHESLGSVDIPHEERLFDQHIFSDLIRIP